MNDSLLKWNPHLDRARARFRKGAHRPSHRHCSSEENWEFDPITGYIFINWPFVDKSCLFIIMSACLFLFDKQYITSSSHHLTEFVRCLFRSKVCFWYQWSSKRCPHNTDKKLRDESPRSSTVSLRNSLFHNKRIRYSWQTLVEKCLDVFATLRDFCWRWPWELIHVNGGSKVFAVLILFNVSDKLLLLLFFKV